jgi:hypothetical protein
MLKYFYKKVTSTEPAIVKFHKTPTKNNTFSKINQEMQGKKNPVHQNITITGKHLKRNYLNS